MGWLCGKDPSGCVARFTPNIKSDLQKNKNKIKTQYAPFIPGTQKDFYLLTIGSPSTL